MARLRALQLNRTDKLPELRERPVGTAGEVLGLYVHDKHRAIEAATGWEIGERLGCGHYGCVFDSDAPWVLKFTRDASEGPIWQYIRELYADPDLSPSMSGCLRVAEVIRLRPDIIWISRRDTEQLPVYAIRREEAYPVFDGRLISSATAARLGAEPNLTLYELQRASADGELFGRGVAAMLDYLYAAADLDEGAVSQSEGRDRMLVAAAQMQVSRWFVDLGETLSTLLEEADTYFRDLHEGNISWRVFERIGDDVRPLTLAISDPGVARTPYRPDVREKLIANRRLRPNPTFEEHLAELRARKARLVERVIADVRRSGGFAAPMRRTDGRVWVTLTRSTRPGIDWQITYWEGEPDGPDAVPTGHRDVTGDLPTAAAELYGLVESP
jgi:hypothetical protein